MTQGGAITVERVITLTQPSPVEGEGVRRKVGPSQSNAWSPSPQPSPVKGEGV